MAKSTRKAGKVLTLALAGLGLAGLLGSRMYESHQKAQVEALDIYIENPELSHIAQTINDAVVRWFAKSDHMKGIRHPQDGRVQYTQWDVEKRITSYVNTQDLKSKLGGRWPSGGIITTERKIGEDKNHSYWKFEELTEGGPDITPQMIQEVRRKAPWVAEAAAGRPYFLRLTHNHQEAQYTLQDGRKITLVDENGNGCADFIHITN